MSEVPDQTEQDAPLSREEINNEGLKLIENLEDALRDHPSFQRAAALHFFTNTIRDRSILPSNLIPFDHNGATYRYTGSFEIDNGTRAAFIMTPAGSSERVSIQLVANYKGVKDPANSFATIVMTGSINSRAAIEGARAFIESLKQAGSEK